MRKVLLPLLLLMAVIGVKAETFTLVTADSEPLKAGDQVIVVAADANFAISTTQGKNNRGQADIVKDGNLIVDPAANVQVFTLAEGTKAGTLMFGVGNDQYLCAASSSSNYLHTGAASENSEALITVSDAGVASIVFQGKYTRNVLQHNAGSKLFSCYGSASQKPVSIYRAEGTEASGVAAPGIALVSDKYNTVEITCSAEGATIYYSVNDGEMLEYTGEFEITEKSKIEAFAVVGEETSNTVTVTLYPNKVSSIADFKALQSPLPVLIETTVTAYACGNGNVYITDGESYINARSQAVVENGANSTWVKGTYNVYNGLTQINYAEFGSFTQGAPVAPTVVELSEITEDMLCMFVEVKNVELQGGALVDSPIALYNSLKIDMPANGTYDMTAVVSIYNGTLQLAPVSFTQVGEVVEYVAAPVFSFADGKKYVLGSALEITCATEGAEIYYSFGEDQAWVAYVDPIAFNEVGSYDVYAYAKKEGMADSEVEHVQFSIYERVQVEGIYAIVDFSEQAIKYGKDTQCTWKADNDMEFTTQAYVSDNSTYPALNSGKLRLYTLSNNVISVEAPQGYCFRAVTFYTADAKVVNINGESVAVDDGAATYMFPGDIFTDNCFSFNVNDEANTAKNYNFSQIEFVLYERGYADITAPKISMVANEYNMVEITCETVGAEIYYELNPNEYEPRDFHYYYGPFAITEPTVVSAYSQLTDSYSETVTVTVYPNKVSSIRDFAVFQSPYETLIDANVTVLAAGNGNVYITDGINYINARTKAETRQGDTYASVSGVYSNYNGMSRINGAEFGPAGEPAEVVATPVALAEIDAWTMAGQLVAVEGVEIENGKFVGTDVVLYNALKVELPADGTYDITAIVIYYNGTTELAPVTFVAVEPAIQTAAAPEFSFSEGEIYYAGSELEITCATKDAAIYYRINEAEEWAAYEGPIAFNNEGDYTVAAYASKEGMEDSQEATVSFSIYDDNMPADGTKATVVFAGQAISYGKGKVCEWTADNELVFSTSATVAVNSTYPARISGKLRLYTLSYNVVTVCAPEGYYFIAAQLYTKDAKVVNFTANGKTATMPVKMGSAVYLFNNNGTYTDTFSFNVNDAANTAKNYNFTEAVFVLGQWEEVETMTLGDETAYTLSSTVENIDFTYTATYSKSYAQKAWRPVYLPFEMPASEFAKVVAFAGYEDDALVFDIVDADDMLRPNTPYAVLLKEGRKTIEYSKTHGTLFPAEANTVSSEGFALCGNYELKTDMATSGAYAIASDGAFHPAASDAAVLKPYRFFLTVPASFDAQALRIKVRGEDTEGIESLFFTTDGDVIYDLNGRRVANPAAGIYIINGQKTLIK